MELEAAAILPTDAEQACLIVRVWNPEVSGPCVVVYRDGDLLDITPSFPTVRDLQEQTDPATAVAQTTCLLYTSPSPRDNGRSRMPSSA